MDVVRLKEFSRQFVQGDLSLVYGPSKKLADIEVAIFRWPRGASKIFLSMSSVYSSLALSQYGGQASRWIYNSRRAWARHMVTFSVDEGLQLSYQVGKGGKGNQDNSEAGVLRFTGVSPTGLVLLLDRWALRAERHGGFASGAAQANARWMLESLLGVALEGLGSIPIDIVRSWQNLYPRPKLFSERVVFTIAGGKKDMS